MKKLAALCLSLLLIFAIPMQMASAEGNSGVFAVGSAAAYPGETVQIPVCIETNPGIVGLRLFIGYDASILTLQSVEDENLFEAGTTVLGNDLTVNPFGMVWENSLSHVNFTQTGTFATLTFAVAADAPAGETTVTIDYEPGSTFDTDLTDVAFETRSSTVTVNALQEETLAVKTAPTKTTYWQGETLDTAGLVLTYTDDHGVATDVTTGFTCRPSTFSTPGTQTVTVTYNGLTATFDVTVKERLTPTITIKTAPAKTTYQVGETLDTTGLVVTYTDFYGEATDLTTGFTCSPTTLDTAGTQTITVTYNGLTATFDVTVNAPAAQDPVFAAGTGSADPGETVEIPILIEGNPGITGLRLYVQYDADVLTLESAQDAGLFPSGVLLGNDFTVNPYAMLWEDSLSATNYTQNGTFVILTFRVKAGAPAGDTPIDIIVDAGSVFNTDLVNVAFGVRAGSVHVNGGWSFDPDTSLHLLESLNGELFVTGLDPDDPYVSDYVLTQGGWSADVVLNEQGTESTGAVLNIYNGNNELVESYTIIMFGDIDGNGAVEMLDVMTSIDIAQGMCAESWAYYDETDENPYIFAADITHDFAVDQFDMMQIIDCVYFARPVNQNWMQEGDPIVIWD